MRAIRLLVLCMLASSAAGQPIPTNPDLVTGELSNGLRYFVLEHATPPKRAEIVLHVDTGSLNETDEQRGVAHFLEHMAFNGSEHFPPGTVVPFFESLGLTFGQHQNASTGFDQTIYKLSLQDNSLETLEKGMLFLSDVAFGLTLPEEEIEKERGIILEEKRARSGGMQRVVDQILSELAPGSLLGERIAIGTEETIRTMDREDFLSYYRRWYVPSNMAVLVVADAEAERVVELIEAHFDRGDRVPQPEDQDIGVTPTEGVRVIVAQDPEVTRTEVTLTRIGPPTPPITTEQDFRRHLVERLGAAAFNERMRDLVADGSATFQRASAGSTVQFKAFRASQASASGRAERWKEMLEQITVEVERARRHGFTEAEVERQKRELLASAEQAAQVSPTMSAWAKITSMTTELGMGKVITSAGQDLELTREHLPGIRADEVNEIFRDLHDYREAVVIVQAPSDLSLPSKDEIAGVVRAALAGEVEAPDERASASKLMAELPEPGTIVEATEHAATGVASAWLGNGVRFHHYFTDYKKDEVAISIRLAGGPIEETASNHGVSQAAARAWQAAATRRLTSIDVRNLMSGKLARVSGAARDDHFELSVRGTGDFEHAMQLAHLLLTEPLLEASAFDNWKQGTLQQIEMMESSPMMAFLQRFVRALYPEPRMRPILTREEVEAITIEQAQAWLDRIVAHAPIEVTVVGDLERDRATDLVLRYVGSLPPRERIGPGTFAEARRVERPPGPRVIDDRIETPTPQAIVFVGFYGADGTDLEATWRLGMARRILMTRMTKQLREEESLVYSISASYSANPAYPAFSTFYAYSPTDPAKADRLAERIDEMFTEFADRGPTAEEVEVARGQALSVLETQVREPSFWMSVLGDLTFRGLDLDLRLGERAAHERMTADEIREAFARCLRPENEFRILMRPAD